MKEIVIASTNQGKIKEIKAMLNEIGIEVRSIQENALIKAQTICNMINKPTLADDSGLEVDALNGAPGIYSARFMGHDTSYDIKNQYIIDAVKGKERGARFVCAMALCIPHEDPILIEEYFYGEIYDHIEGEKGFGYDPIFYVPELHKTSAALTLAEKNQYSHRAKALRKLRHPSRSRKLKDFLTD